jgi:hypothetical protein
MKRNLIEFKFKDHGKHGLLMKSYTKIFYKILYLDHQNIHLIKIDGFMLARLNHKKQKAILVKDQVN